jgi:hypothetical protein
MNELNLVPWTAEHYPMVAEWWAGHSQTPIPEALLPAYGALSIDAAGNFRAAAWFSLDPVSRCAHLDFLVTSPGNTLKETPRFTLPLLGFLAESARSMGADILWANVRHPWLVRQAEKVGFEVSGEASTVLYKVLLEG